MKYDHKYKKEVKEICEMLKEERNVVKGVKDYQNIPAKTGESKNETVTEQVSLNQVKSKWVETGH